jgi:hypothetical protein
MAFPSSSRSNTMRSSSSRSVQMPQNNNPISKDQAMFISQLLSVIPTPDNGPTARRGFALQAAKQADVAEFFPGWQLDHVSVTAASKIIDTLMTDKKAKDFTSAIGVAGWLDGLAAKGVGTEQATAWAAAKAGQLSQNAVKAASLSSLDRLRGVMPQQAAPVTPAAPAAPAVDLNDLVAKAVAAALASVTEANNKVIAELMERNAALMNAATEAKTEAAAATAEEVTVTPAVKGGKAAAAK